MSEHAKKDPEERLESLRAERAEEANASPNLLLRFGLPLLILLAIFVWFLPRIVAPDGGGKRVLERSIAYCKFSEHIEICTSQIRTRHAICAKRVDESEGLEDAYGPCMEEAFPNFYITVAGNLPKSAEPL